MRQRAAAALLAAAAPLGALLATPPLGDGPPPGRTGGFGEPTCLQCHVGEAPDAPGITLRLEGLPDALVPGERYRVTVVLERDGLARGGFQLAARYRDGDSAGMSAGTLRALDGRTQVLRDPVRHVDYVEHTRAGTAPQRRGANRWEFEWTAGADRDVLVHAAAVAANDDDSNLGDVVVRRSQRIAARH